MATGLNEITTRTTLIDLLSNSLVLRQTAPYLPISALLALARTSKASHDLVHTSAGVFRHLDLSTVKSAVLPYAPLDAGGISWRAERMDESLTEDEFYSGPLRGIFSKLDRQHLLQDIQTLVLDGLSVPADLVREIIAEDRFNVRILSIREAKHLNERKLQQVLRHAVRPTRQEGTPRLRGLYVFGLKDSTAEDGMRKPMSRNPSPPPCGVMASEGAQLGAAWNQRSSAALAKALSGCEDKWYQPSGRMFSKPLSREWAETLQACEGIIAFDAVLCRGPRHNVETAYVARGEESITNHPLSYLRPAIATVALGMGGCVSCGSCPEEPASQGSAKLSELPLLTPLPLHSSTVRAAQKPTTTHGSSSLPLMVRCEDCMKGRWCERCNKFWCENCYTGSAVSGRTALQQTEYMEDMMQAIEARNNKEIKVHMGLCTESCLVSEMMSGAGEAGMWG